MRFVAVGHRVVRHSIIGGIRLATIRLEGLSVFGHHGARPYEKEAGQRLEVDLELEPADDRAERSDRLADAVLWYRDRTRPEGHRLIRGSEIVDLERRYFTTASGRLPFYKIARIELGGEVLFERR